ncbi:hypothetical protein A4X09_0g6525 [Tilletia walkeri]|uniref:RING-type domain-containing protein n=1 Tax=Tilletia walkeri TaxID=117179 RepID=A0A8X7N590_9BASI|nr:hypothetical protein A4X09_0g6525 [Tilletia walkeri]
MTSLLRRTRNAIVDSRPIAFFFSSDSNGTTTSSSSAADAATTALEDLIAFANLSAGTLRSMGGNGLLIRIPVTAGVDPSTLAAAKYAAATAAAAATAVTAKVLSAQQSTPSQAVVSSSSSSSSSFASRLDLPSHLGGAGILGFFTSRWFVVLVLVTALINRIQHNCRPRTRPQLIQGWKRVLLKLPALFLLSRSMIALFGVSIMLADISRQYHAAEMVGGGGHLETTPPLPTGALATFTARYLPENWAQRAWLGDLFVSPTSGQYRIEARSSTYIWASFLAAAATVVTESLIKSLEGGRDQDLHSFNLTGFAYITHAYVFSPDSEHGYPGTPTWSLFFSTFLQIAELWTLSVASLSRARPRSRLPVTTVFGIASTIHHLHWRYIGNPTDPLHIMNRFPDAILLGVILLTACLHALTMAVTEGKIEFSRLLFNASNLPAMTEDYNLALFKLGTACLESTRLSGMSRELATIRTPAGTWVEMDGAGTVNVHGGAAAGGSGLLPGGGGVSSALVRGGATTGGLRRLAGGTRAVLDRDENVVLPGSSEDERDTIVRHRRSSRRAAAAAAKERGEEGSGVGDAARVAALRNGFALEIRDLRTAADATFARSSFAILSGANPTRLAEARRFGLTLLRVLLALFTLIFVWSWSWIPPVIRLPAERRIFRPTKRRVRRVVRWTRRKVPRYVRLLWHGSIGETRREEALRARRNEEARTAAERAARLVQPGSAAAAAAAAGGAGAGRAGAAAEVAEEGRPVGPEDLFRFARDGMLRAMSPESGASDARFWQAFVDPDAPEYEDEGSEKDGDWREDESEDEEEEEGDEDEGGEGEGADAIARQLAARSSRMRGRSPSVGLSEYEEGDEEEDEEEEGALALTLAAQRGGPSSLASSSRVQSEAEADRDMSQYLLMHLSNSGRSPLTRTRFRQLVGGGPSSSRNVMMGDPTGAGGAGAAQESRGPFGLLSRNRAEVAAGDDGQVLVDVIRARREMAMRALGEGGPGAAAVVQGGAGDDEQRAEWERERQRLCVICQTENRTILIWPCRCLALCEECRDNLASRPVPGKSQTCPCCRTPVAGFSRLFLP